MDGCVLPGAWSAVGLVKLLPEVCSKNSSGTELEEEEGSPGGTGWGRLPLPLPARPCVKKSHRLTESRSGSFLEYSPAASHKPGDTEEERPGQQSRAGAGPRGGFFPPAVSEGGLGPCIDFCHCLWVQSAWELLGPDVVWLPESRPAGEESPGWFTLCPDLGQLAFSAMSSAC